MKLFYLTIASVLLSVFCCKAQNQPLLKYKGVWSVSREDGWQTDIKEIEILDDSKLTLKTLAQFVDVETGEATEETLQCYSDTTTAPRYFYHALKDTTFLDTILDFSHGDERFVNPNLVVNDSIFARSEKVYKGFIIKNIQDTPFADVFNFKIDCTEKMQMIECVFYSDKRGTLIVYYTNSVYALQLKKN